MEELFVYPHKYKHIPILHQKLFEAMTASIMAVSTFILVKGFSLSRFRS